MKTAVARFGLVLVAALVGVGNSLVHGGTARSIASSAPVPSTQPLTNLAPNPPYYPPCEVVGTTVVSGLCSYVSATGTFSYNTPAAAHAALSALNHGLATEGLPPIQVTDAFWTLPASQQFFILTDGMRVREGLPAAVALEQNLNGVALAGAQSQTDPSLPSGFQWQGRMGSVWSGGEGAVESLYNFLYQDGYGSDNLDCPSPTSTGCWGHRLVLLGHYGPQPLMGVAETRVNGTRSLAALLLSGTGNGAAAAFTWQEGQAYLQTPPGVTNPPLPFQDLGTAPWAVPAIQDLTNRGLLQGLSPSQFGPNQPVTVEMAAALLNRILPPATGAAAPLPPIPAPAWATPGLERLAAAGAPLPPPPWNVPISRLQMARLLAGTLYLPTPLASPTFTDTASLPAPDQTAINTVTAAGLLQGVAPEAFQPLGPVSRAQLAVILERVLQKGYLPPGGPG